MSRGKWRTTAYEAGIVLAMLGGVVIFLIDESIKSWRAKRAEKNRAYNERIYPKLPAKEDVIAASTTALQPLSSGKPEAPQLPPLDERELG